MLGGCLAVIWKNLDYEDLSRVCPLEPLIGYGDRYQRTGAIVDLETAIQ